MLGRLLGLLSSLWLSGLARLSGSRPVLAGLSWLGLVTGLLRSLPGLGGLAGLLGAVLLGTGRLSRSVLRL